MRPTDPDPGGTTLKALPNLSSADLSTLGEFAKALPQGKTQFLDPTNTSQNHVIRLCLQAGGFTEDKYPALYKALQPGAQPGGPSQDTLTLVDAGKTADGLATA